MTLYRLNAVLLSRLFGACSMQPHQWTRVRGSYLPSLRPKLEYAVIPFSFTSLTALPPSFMSFIVSISALLVPVRYGTVGTTKPSPGCPI